MLNFEGQSRCQIERFDVIRKNKNKNLKSIRN